MSKKAMYIHTLNLKTLCATRHLSLQEFPFIGGDSCLFLVAADWSGGGGEGWGGRANYNKIKQWSLLPSLTLSLEHLEATVGLLSDLISILLYLRK